MHRKPHAFLAGLLLAFARLTGDDASPEMRAAIMQDQAEALGRVRPVAMAAGTLGAFIAWWCLHDLVDQVLLTGWLVAMFAIVAVDLLTGPPLRGWRPAEGEVERFHWHGVCVSLAKGACWGALVTMFYRDAGAEGQLIVAVLLTALLASVPFILSAAPVLVYAFVGPLAVQASLVFGASGVHEHVFELVLLVTYAIILPFVLRQQARTFAERSIAHARLDEQKQLIGLLLNDFESNSGDWLWQTDAELRIQRVSDAFAKQSGVAPSELAGEHVDDFIAFRLSGDPELDAGAMRLRAHFAAREAFRELELYMRFGQEDHWWCVTGTPSFDRDGRFVGYRGIGREITDRKRAERQLTYLAHHDTLTGVANRASFNGQLDGLREAVAGGRRFALIVFDLDDFKVVNDTAGHAIGDEVLRTACRRIAAALPPKAFLARTGGDEFAAVLELGPGIAGEEVRDLANGIVAEVKQPILLPEGTFRIGISAGVAIMPDDGAEPGVVVQLADVALYSAKEAGKQGVGLANPAETAAHSQRRTLELDLRRAVEEGQLQLLFQPTIDSRSGRTVAFEALARWRHPVFGEISPASFIPMAEHTGLIHEVGRWALEQACRSAVDWPEPLRVAVNISPRQFERDDLADTIAGVLRTTGLPPRRLEIEITESIYLGGIEMVRRTVSRLRSLGIGIAMDDFGTGYSSLSSLQDIPFDRLKIDQSLARQRNPDRRTLAILRSIVAIGKALGLHVTAEGVETREQAQLLRGLGCGSLQGYLFGMPMTLEEIPAFLLAEARGGNRFDALDRPAGEANAA